MISNLEIGSISDRANKIFANIQKSKWRYYHKKSVENFIFYLSKVKGKSEKDELAQIITNYLDEIDNEVEEVDMELSMYLYNQYLNKLASKFQWRLGFVPIFPVKSLIVLIPALTIILVLAYSSKYFFYTLLFFLSLYIVRLIIKMRKRKIYGFGY